MNNEKINAFFNDIFIDKFLVNFVPGLILFYALYSFISFSTGDGLLSLLIITIISWILGLLLEMVFYGKTYKNRRVGIAFTIDDSLRLLFSKIGLSIIIAVFISIFMPEILQQITKTEIRPFETSFFERKEADLRIVFMFIKGFAFIAVGMYLYLRYPNKNPDKIEE
ncbi:hypothetical protein KORDIASMS9_00102 [Kordia sp. SMS9]|uniref:hypothetical protein n=1 Tax=Kordia sp. SMS9 TaxID=2282170 RepID=UPI000E0CC425|nr:hypothetical protein [Kordia sp. SMS9]AXG67920.1 hypothetical protein KORDIASMS9_00102 [Kordia sp. SMS9]